MLTVSVSPKFQVVIPRQIREALGVKAGQRMQAVRGGGLADADVGDAGGQLWNGLHQRSAVAAFWHGGCASGAVVLL